MTSRCSAIWCITMALLAAAACAASADQPKSPVPSTDDQAAARQQIQREYKVFFDRTAPADELDLANTLTDVASRTYNDPAKRYMLLVLARQLAIKAGDVDAADAACRKISQYFDVPLAAARLQMLQQADTVRQGRDSSAAFAYSALRAVDDALTQDDFSSANSLLQLADGAARDVGDPDLSAAVAARKDQLSLQQSGHATIAANLAVLAGHPNDPDANLAVGKYDCFVRGDWGDGLPMLTKSNDPQLKQIAALDMGNPDKPSVQADVGDQWCDYATAQSIKGNQIQLRAYFWFQKAASSATGLTAKLVSVRMEELRPALGGRGGSDQIWFAIDKAIRNKSYADSQMCGGAFAHVEVEDVPSNGALLVGLRVGRDTFGNNPTVGYYQAIYLTRDGETLGQPVGTLKGDPVILKARPGYAVGAIVARGGGGMDALTVTFMKIDGARLDPSTAYTSETVGGNGGGETDYDGKGTPIIGIHGKQDVKWPGFGVVFLAPVDNSH
jgi:hypothetical protein